MDGHCITYSNQFDAIFSNAALHWLSQPEQVIQGAFQALKARGRFVAEFGGAGNIAALLHAMQAVFSEHPDFGQFNMPWYFPSAAEYQLLLEQAGFEVMSIALIPRPTPLSSGIEKWLEIFAEGIIRHLSQAQKTVFLVAVRDKLLPSLYSKESGWVADVADYVRLRFTAIKA